MRDFTDITVVLDRSGSMQSVKEATVSGFDEFVQSQKLKGDNASLTLIQFDDQYDVVWNGLPISSVPTIAGLYQPRSMTALLDAIGRAINDTGARLAKMHERDRPNKVIMVILTDGLENASREFDSIKINEMIKRQESDYNWSFIFLGANQDAIATATNLGIKPGWAADYSASSSGTKKSFGKMSDKVAQYRCCSSDLEAVSFAGNNKLWTEEDREDLTSE